MSTYNSKSSYDTPSGGHLGGQRRSQHYVNTDYGCDIPLIVENFSLDSFADLSRVVPNKKGKQKFASLLTKEVPYSRGLGRELYNMAKEIIPLTVDTIYRGVPSNYEYCSELRLFLLYVMVYKGVQKWKIEPEFEPLLSLLEGPSFAERLKKRRTQYMLESFDAINQDGYHSNESWYIYEYYFLPKYCFLWQENNNDFFEWSYVPTMDTFDPCFIDIYKSQLKDLLDEFCPGHLNIVSDDEFIMSISGASSFMKDGSKKPEWYNAEPEYEKTYRATLCPIMKNPTDSRDIVILSHGCKLTLQRTNYYLKELLKHLPFSAMNGKPIKQQVSSFMKRNKDCWYYMRDLRKEGLTKPHWIAKATYEVLKDKYPKVPWDGLLMLANPHYYDNNNKELPKVSRGHGLGMGNELTTIMQIVMHYILRESLPDDVDIVDALYYNDDSVIAVSGQEIGLDSLTVCQSDILMANSMDIIINAKKSFVSPHSFLFCEEYVSLGSFVSKSILYRFASMQALACENIQHAKAYISSLPTVPKDCMAEVLRWWGYEFTMDEINSPYLCGGWFKPIQNGLDQTLIWAYDNWEKVVTIPLTRKLCINGKPHVSLKNPLKGKFIHPAIKRFNITDIIWNDETERLLIGTSNQSVADNFVKLSYAASVYEKYWKTKVQWVPKTSWGRTEWIGKVFRNFPGPFALPRGLDFIDEIPIYDSTIYEIKPDKFIGELISSDNSILSYLKYLKNEGLIKCMSLPDDIQPSKLSLLYNPDLRRKMAVSDNLFIPGYNGTYEIREYYVVNPKAVLSAVNYTSNPEIVVDDYIYRHGHIPIFRQEESFEEPCFRDTRIKIDPVMLKEYYESNEPWVDVVKVNQVIVYLCDRWSYEEGKAETLDWIQQAREDPKPPQRNPIDVEFEYYKNLLNIYMVGDKVNKFCYDLAVSRVEGTHEVATIDDLMYAWDRFEPAHMDKAHEEAFVAYKKFLMVDYHRLSGDWVAKTTEEKIAIAKGFKVGPHLALLKETVPSGVIADEVWLAWGLDPPEEESFCGFGSDDDMLW